MEFDFNDQGEIGTGLKHVNTYTETHNIIPINSEIYQINWQQ